MPNLLSQQRALCQCWQRPCTRQRRAKAAHRAREPRGRGGGSTQQIRAERAEGEGEGGGGGVLVQQPCVTGAWCSDHPDDQVHVLLRHERRHHQRPDASLSLRLRPTGTVRASVTAGIVCVPQLFGVRRLPFAARRRGRGPDCPAPEASKTLPGPPAHPSVRASWAGQSTGRRG